MDLVGAKDIAERAGVKVDSVHKWRDRHSAFPQPVAIVSGSIPVWTWGSVRRWLETTGRWDGGPQQDVAAPSNRQKWER